MQRLGKKANGWRRPVWEMGPTGLEVKSRVSHKHELVQIWISILYIKHGFAMDLGHVLVLPGRQPRIQWVLQKKRASFLQSRDTRTAPGCAWSSALPPWRVNIWTQTCQLGWQRTTNTGDNPVHRTHGVAVNLGWTFGSRLNHCLALHSPHQQTSDGAEPKLLKG